MSQKINATDVTEEEALNAVFFERADEFIKQANDFCRPPKGQQAKPEEFMSLRTIVSRIAALEEEVKKSKEVPAKQDAKTTSSGKPKGMDVALH